MTIQIVDKGIIINGFIGGDGQDSNWSVRIENHPTIPELTKVHLYWGDKETPTHSAAVKKTELKTLVGTL